MVKRKTKSSKKRKNKMEIVRGTSEAARGDPQISDKGAGDPVGSASRGGPTRSEQKQQTVHSVADSRSRRTSHRSQRRGDSIKTKSAHRSSRRVSQPLSRSRPGGIDIDTREEVETEVDPGGGVVKARGDILIMKRRDIGR